MSDFVTAEGIDLLEAVAALIALFIVAAAALWPYRLYQRERQAMTPEQRRAADEADKYENQLW